MYVPIFNQLIMFLFDILKKKSLKTKSSIYIILLVYLFHNAPRVRIMHVG